MKRLTIILCFALIGGLAACSDDDGDAGTPDANTVDAANTPDAAEEVVMMPALSATQIDRMGRPAIPTALLETFNGDADAQGAARDGYVQNTDPSTWNQYAAAFMGSLAILDSLDTDCTNQLGRDLDPATPYAALAGLLADDRLYVNAAGTTFDGVYLGVEANALSIVPNDDGGGRPLAADVIDTSYSVLAIGALGGVTDGVAGNDVAFDANFPYLGAAQ